jgi:aspartate aminotransferase, cytoplasmic
MSNNNNHFTSSSSSSHQQPINRLQQVNAHMGSLNGTSNATAFGSDVVPQAPEDPMFGLMAAYRRDTDPKKVDLGIGAYRDNHGKPWILPVVKQVYNTQFCMAV